MSDSNPFYYDAVGDLRNAALGSEAATSLAEHEAHERRVADISMEIETSPNNARREGLETGLAYMEAMWAYNRGGIDIDYLREKREEMEALAPAVDALRRDEHPASSVMHEKFSDVVSNVQERHPELAERSSSRAIEDHEKGRVPTPERDVDQGRSLDDLPGERDRGAPNRAIENARADHARQDEKRQASGTAFNRDTHEASMRRCQKTVEDNYMKDRGQERGEGRDDSRDAENDLSR